MDVLSSAYTPQLKGRTCWGDWNGGQDDVSYRGKGIPGGGKQLFMEVKWNTGIRYWLRRKFKKNNNKKEMECGETLVADLELDPDIVSEEAGKLYSELQVISHNATHSCHIPD